MSNHQASEQMIGYLYQVRYALSLLLASDNLDSQISIEKFDDVAFSEDDIPVECIQLKHHINNKGNLSDASVDMWRTLKVWLDIIEDKKDILDGTIFTIITTATAPKDSAASLLKPEKDERKPLEAYKKLKFVSLNSKNEKAQVYYEKFKTTEEDVLKKVVDKIYIIDRASNIIDVEKDIIKQIRYCCIPKYQNRVCERLEGWWFKQAIIALCSDQPVFVNQNQVRSFIVSISQEYADDNLPIDDFESGDSVGIDFSKDEKIFYEQLKLISLSSRNMQIALWDYYRAFKQRASWVRDDLLYVNELEHYEQRLVDEWNHAFAEMEENLSEKDEVTEKEKAIEGRNLFFNMGKGNIRIRPKCEEAFIMRGSYHMLANQMKIGWHIDFLERLRHLLDI